MTPSDHTAPLNVGANVSIVSSYLSPDDDPDMQEYDNAGDIIVIAEASNER